MTSALTEEKPLVPSSIGTYTLESEIGRGGMGVVYRARDRLGREVALKTLVGGAFASDAERARFRAEAEAAAALSHENLVPIFDFGEHDGLPYYTMEYVAGGSLASRIDEVRGDARRVAALVRDVARGVHHAHDHGVLHRDLKPANILLDGSERRPRVADFGLARAIGKEGLTTDGNVAGTPGYMAPEMVSKRARELTRAVDVYGLGAILYELLSGRPPVEDLEHLLKEDPRDVCVVDRAVPRDLGAVCMRCLERDPAKRYPSAKLLADDLDSWLSGEGVSVRAPGWFVRLMRWAKRRPAFAGVTATAILLVVVTTIITLSVARAQEQELRDEALATNAYAARFVAGSVQLELRTIQDFVESAVMQAALIESVADDDVDAIEDVLCKLSRPQAIDSLLVLDEGGVWRSRCPISRDQRGKDYSFRDYFQCTMTTAHNSCVARAYVSEANKTLRFAVGARIVKDGEVQGVLIASLEADEAFGSLELDDDRRKAVIVGRKGVERSDSDLPSTWVVLAHDQLAPGSLVEIESPTLDKLSSGETLTDSAHRDPVPGFEGPWLAGFAPVAGAPMAVIVQMRPDDHGLARRLLVGAGVALAVGALASALMLVLSRSRRR